MKTWTHPDYKRGTVGVGDLALIELDSSPPVPFLGFRRETLPYEPNESLEFVGYGFSEFHGANGIGTRRSTHMQLRSSGGADISYLIPEKGICHGDSGGPAIQRSEMGQLVAGVTSWGDESCDGIGHSVNVGHYAAWISAILSLIHEPAQDPQLQGPHVSSTLCDSGQAAPNGKTCLIYVSSPRTLAEANTAKLTLEARGVRDVQIWKPPTGTLAVTVCGGPADCPVAKTVVDKVRKELAPQAVLFPGVSKWTRLVPP